MTSQFHPRASPVVLENYESHNAPQHSGPKLLAQLSRRAPARLPWNQEDTLSPARHAAGIRAAPAGTCSFVLWECPLRNVGRRLGAEAARVRVRSARAGRPGHRSGSWAPVGFAAEAVRVFRAEGRGEVRREERGRAGRSGRGRASGVRCRLRRAGRRPRVRRGAAGAGECGAAGGAGSLPATPRFLSPRVRPARLHLGEAAGSAHLRARARGGGRERRPLPAAALLFF